MIYLSIRLIKKISSTLGMIILAVLLNLIRESLSFAEPLLDNVNLYNYCQESRLYYPDVLECPNGWIKVSPSLLNDPPLVIIKKYPNLIQIPQYPVYYDPYSNINYFFYDGAYWLFINEMWYSSIWFNGPWYYVSPNFVPLGILRVPIRYYRQPPRHFLIWDVNQYPHWNEYWGQEWAETHGNWNRSDFKYPRRAAPLPSYQKDYLDDRYPTNPDEQQLIHSRNYRYQPNEIKHFEKNTLANDSPVEFKRNTFIPREFLSPQRDEEHIENKIEEAIPSEASNPKILKKQEFQKQPTIQRYENTNSGPARFQFIPRQEKIKR